MIVHQVERLPLVLHTAIPDPTEYSKVWSEYLSIQSLLYTIPSLKPAQTQVRIRVRN